ncbi:MAG: enoyl-CoA hydratase/isomerase family protein [Gemmatimonadaceae bacterium]
MSRIRLERQGAIGRIILSRPERKNALDRPMVAELFEAASQFEQDGQVRVVHLLADGDDFCVGADLQALTTALGTASEAHREDAEAYGRVLLGIRALMKPVVCSVRGRALGAGTGLATACDLVLAHEGAEFGYPEVRFGAVPALVMALLRRTVGEKHAADLVLTGRIIAAEEAERIGLVSRVLPAASYEQDVAAVLKSMSASPATSLALTKWLLYKLDALSFEDGVAAGVVTDVEARATTEFQDGVRRMADQDRPK